MTMALVSGDIAPAYQSGFYVLAFFVFVIGSCIGSFLNVCIWRIPNKMSIITPGSHCPKCQHVLSWYENIPVLAWLVLGRKCRQCKGPISIRYPLVEALVGLLFLIFWLRSWHQGWTIAWFLVVCYLISTLVAVSVVDYEHEIIPDEFTAAGCIIAVLVAIILPGTHAHAGSAAGWITRDVADLLSGVSPAVYSPRVWAGIDVILGVSLGGGSFWLLGKVGKLLFGRKRHRLDPVTCVALTASSLRVGDDQYEWDELFCWDTDEVEIRGIITTAELRGGAKRQVFKRRDDLTTVTVTCETIRIEGDEVPLSRVRELVLEATEWTQPREAVGLGDVKLLVMLGAFLGPTAIVFIIGLASILGTVVGALAGVIQALRGGRWLGLVRFGPFLAFATIVYLLRGTEWMNILKWRVLMG